jgi:hypothetical protein
MRCGIVLAVLTSQDERAEGDEDLAVYLAPPRDETYQIGRVTRGDMVWEAYCYGPRALLCGDQHRPSHYEQTRREALIALLVGSVPSIVDAMFSPVPTGPRGDRC